MGQEVSSPIDENTPPRTLEARSLDALANYVKLGRAKNIVVMVSQIASYLTPVPVERLTLMQLRKTGAGISTSAGIPDFRSPDTGLYANLARLDLPYPEAVFDISFFRNNPLPFYTLAHELYPGKYRPTISHSFVRLLSDKGLLLKLFTQNIDCLEREAGVPDENIVEAHGSFARQSCIECKTPYSKDLMKQAITNREVPHCLGPQCNGLVKPDIVFFGEQLPDEFHRNRGLPCRADMCIIMGTSLTVQPFASLPSLCSENVPRLLINSERVGDLGCRPDDVLLLGDCDDGVRKLASALGWEKELEALWEATKPDEVSVQCPPTGSKSQDEALEHEIASLTGQVDKALKLASDHTSQTRDHLLREGEKSPQSQVDSSGISSSSSPAARDPSLTVMADKGNREEDRLIPHSPKAVTETTAPSFNKASQGDLSAIDPNKPSL